MRFEDASEDPYVRMPREVLEHFGSDVDAVSARFEGAHYFHGTRVVDPQQFQSRGILPLDEVVEQIWRILYDLVQAEVSSEQWDEVRRLIESGAGGHDGWLYRLKTGSRLHYGPHALLVREFLFMPQETGSHDYLACPEIVQDISRCFKSVHGIDLEERFCRAAVPCIVKFRRTDTCLEATRIALWYAFSKLREGRLTSNANGGFDGRGQPIPPDDVMGIEVIAS